MRLDDSERRRNLTRTQAVSSANSLLFGVARKHYRDVSVRMTHVYMGWRVLAWRQPHAYTKGANAQNGRQGEYNLAVGFSQEASCLLVLDRRMLFRAPSAAILAVRSGVERLSSAMADSTAQSTLLHFPHVRHRHSPLPPAARGSRHRPRRSPRLSQDAVRPGSPRRLGPRAPAHPRTGGLLILRVPDDDAIPSLDRIRDGDPYYQRGLAQYELIQWAPTIGKDELDTM